MRPQIIDNSKYFWNYGIPIIIVVLFSHVVVTFYNAVAEEGGENRDHDIIRLKTDSFDDDDSALSTLWGETSIRSSSESAKEFSEVNITVELWDGLFNFVMPRHVV